MKVVIAPDSFKGSLTAQQVAQAMMAGVLQAWPDAVCSRMPMADGGEGTLAVVAGACQGEYLLVDTINAEGRAIQAPIWRGERGDVLIEVAQVVGLPGVTQSAVADRTTAGVGRLIRHALERGATHIEVALGGSATNDGGVGMLAELGCRFLDHAGHPIVPTLTGLGVLASVEASGLDARLRGGSLSILSDVVNPLCGASGASYVFGPQKGMLPAQCDEFDCILGRYAGLLQSVLRVGEVAQSPGAGAAGGLGFALQCLGGVQQSGARQIANRIGLPAAIAQADWVLTGEGRTDAQTLSGKAPVEVARLARAAGVPVTLVSGGLVKADIEKLSAEFDGLFSVVCGPMTLVQAQTEAAELLTQQVAQLARFARATRGW